MHICWINLKGDSTKTECIILSMYCNSKYLIFICDLDSYTNPLILYYRFEGLPLHIDKLLCQLNLPSLLTSYSKIVYNRFIQRFVNHLFFF